MQEDGKTYMNGYNSKFLATVELSEKDNGKDLSSIQGDIEVYANVKNDQIVSIDGGHISLHKR